LWVVERDLPPPPFYLCFVLVVEERDMPRRAKSRATQIHAPRIHPRKFHATPSRTNAQFSAARPIARNHSIPANTAKSRHAITFGFGKKGYLPDLL